MLSEIQELLQADWCSEKECFATITETYNKSGADRLMLIKCMEFDQFIAQINVSSFRNTIMYNKECR